MSFAVGHSLLAAPAVQARLRPSLGAAYRLVYNVVAAVHLLVVMGVGRLALGDLAAFDLPNWMRIAMGVVSLAGVAVLIAGLRGYDLSRFGGVAQLRAARAGRHLPEDEPLRLDGLHRYVRHPLYLGGMLVLWGLASDPLGLATAAWGSLYLVVGPWFEERKLLRLYGQAYAEYRAKVPAFLPWRGRAI